MKKEYHYTLARTDRICLVLFVASLLGWELIKGLFPGGDTEYTYVPSEKKTYNKPKKNYPKKEYSYKKYNKQNNDYSKYWKNDRFNEASPSPPSSPLPIMEASIKDLRSMGFAVKTSFNIQKYIASGGIISSATDLMKIYGMDSLQLSKVEPNIVYAPSFVMNTSDTLFRKSDTKKAMTIVDLNTSTIEELEALNGIGTKLAERIIKFRESLGGFHSKEQLKDCYGITPELFQQLESVLSASGTPNMIKINSVDLSSIKHPYLNRKMANIISAYITQHGSIPDAEELKKVYPADSVWFEKIIPYLDFTNP